MGVRIPIDDFGTGYSNLSYLRRLPVHGRAQDADPVNERIVVTLAHTLDLTVTAEGVENAAQLERLHTLHCDAGQGWFFAPPGPPEQIDVMLHTAAPLGGLGKGRQSR